MAHAEIDPVLDAWAARRGVVVISAAPGRAERTMYVSSCAGDTFQIWVESPDGDVVAVRAACVEGAREDEAPRGWTVAVDRIESGLDQAWTTVLGWMAPADRFTPPPCPGS